MKKNRLLFAFSVSFTVLLGVVVCTDNSYAASTPQTGPCFFKPGAAYAIGDVTTCKTGTSQYGDYGYNDVFTGRPNDDALKDIKSISDLENFLLNNFNDGGYQDQIGAAFTIKRLISDCSSNCDWPTSDDITDFKERIEQDGIEFSITEPVSINERVAYFDNVNNNELFANPSSTHKQLIVISYKGVVYAKIEIACGNLLANSIPLPKKTVVVPGSHGNCRPFLISIPQINDFFGDQVEIYVDGTNTTGSGSVKHGPTTQETVDVTTKCTTGDIWNFHIYSSSYVYYAEWDCVDEDEYGCNEYDWVNKKYTEYDSNKQQGPCFDYALNTEVKDVGYYQVEVNSELNIKPSLTSLSYTSTPSEWLKTGQLGLTTDDDWADFSSAYPNLHTKSKASKWQISRLIVKPGHSVPDIKNISDSELDPCGYYYSKGMEGCQVVSISTADTVFSKNTNPTASPSLPASVTDVVIDEPAGSKICYAFSVYPAHSDPSYSSINPDNMWSNSGIDPIKNCVIIVKKPKVQVKGGDLSVGKSNSSSSVYTTISVKSFGVFGSWGEYGIYAPGEINGMASGAAFANPLLVGVNGGDINICDYSALTFTNAGTASCDSTTQKGYYTPKTLIPSVKNSFSGATLTIDGDTTISPESDLSGDGLHIVQVNGNLDLISSTLQPKQSVVLKVSGTVTIEGNQYYSDVSYTGISQLPQLVIIAGDGINISNEVDNIDAWLITEGAINTCEEGGTDEPLTIDDCDNQLTVNGPVMANKLYLRRTAGSNPGLGEDYGSGMPAEIFNLRADSILWAYSMSTGSGKVQTVYATELPPRF